MSNDTKDLIEKRQLLRGVADLLAGSMSDAQRETFSLQADAEINKKYPAPSRERMRSYLRTNIAR